MNKYVWTYGLIAAVAAALLAVPELPANFTLLLKLVGVVAGVLAGYHYPAPGSGDGPKGGGLALLALTLCVLAAGCATGKIDVTVKDPQCGTLGVSVDRGSGGTNPPNVSVLLALPEGTNAILDSAGVK